MVYYTTLRKRNHKWVKLKSYKGQRSRSARWYKVSCACEKL